MRSSTLSPKIHRYHMFPMKCIQPPCRNMDVMSVATSTGMDVSPASDANSRPGTTPHSRRNSGMFSPSESSYRNAIRFARMIARVTTGILCAGLSSRSGIIGRVRAWVGRRGGRENHGSAHRVIDVLSGAAYSARPAVKPRATRHGSPHPNRHKFVKVAPDLPERRPTPFKIDPTALGPQMDPRRIVMSNAIPVTDANFDSEVLKSNTPVLVDFWASWCGPCRAVAPTVEALANEFGGKLKVVKLNTDEEQEIAIKYGVGSIPTLMVFKNGEMVERVIGNRPKAELAAMVSRHVDGGAPTRH